MARYTEAYSIFAKNLTEVNTLQSLAHSYQIRDPIVFHNEINALSRGSIVLLSSHLEAYIKRLGEVALDSMYTRSVPRTGLSSRFYYYISKDIIDEIRNTSDPKSLGEKIFSLLERDLSYWSHTGPFPSQIQVDRFNKGFSNPTFKKIEKYFNRFGYENYGRDLATLLAGAYQLTTNAVDNLIDIRNQIAHGDPRITRTPSELKEMIRTIRFFCRITDGVFATWWKENFCSIR